MDRCGSTALGRRSRPTHERDAGAARRLRDVLRCEVLDGRFPGGVLPTEGELMLTHRARRAVVREALALLRDEGVVERARGVGTYALRERHIARLAEIHGVASRPEDVLMGALDRPAAMTRHTVPAPDAIARRLGIEVGAAVLRIDYVATIDGRPLGLATNYLAFPEADAVADVPFRADFYSLIRDAGLEIGGSEFVLSAVNADRHVAASLEVPQGTAMMLAEQAIWDRAGRVYDIAICYLRTDPVVFSSTRWAVGARDGSRTVFSSTALDAVAH